MSTPITDAVNSDRYVDHYEGYCAMLNNARRLELDRAALMEALEDIINDGFDHGGPKIKAARSAFAAARANFPES